MQPLLDPAQTWTFEDLQRLPEDADWRRYEIVDGALVVSPSASIDHEFVIDELRTALRPLLPDGLWVGGPLTVDLDPSYRIPDLIVISRRLIGSGRTLFSPAELSLAVEVVSPSSSTTDRITKPAQYAAAGIAAYWRVETEPDVTLTAYALPTGAATYAELGSWGPGETAEVDSPFPARIPIDALRPRS